MRIYWFFFGSLFLLSLISYFFIDPNFFPLAKFYSGFAFEERELVSLSYVILVVSLFVAYIAILRSFIKEKINKEQAIALVIFSSTILFFSYPAMLSYDIFNYITTAKVTFHYLENPYLVMPVEFMGDSNLLFTHAANKYALYGPSWILITALPYLLSLKNIILSIIAFKTLNYLFYFGTLFLMLRLSGKIYPVILFGLNPLVLIETLLSGHNDIALVFFALLSFHLLLMNRKILSGFSMLFSVFIKFASGFLIPVYVLMFVKKIRKEKVDLNRIFTYSSYLMLIIFFLSAFRVEIYPWYAIWFLVFAYLSKNKFLHGLSLILSFSLLFRYVPFMFFGTHFGPTPFLKTAFTFIPFMAYVVFFKIIKNKFSLLSHE